MTTAERRQYRIAGGIAAWPIPIASAILGLGALSLDAIEPLLAIALFGLGAQMVWRGAVVEISPAGVTRGFMLNGRFVGRTTVLAWSTIATVHTEWRQPGDDTALVTTVSDREGRSIELSTTMGLRDYCRCLAAITSSAPFAARSGLTEAVLEDGPPGRQGLISAAATAGLLALVVIALVGVHYLWAQGRSSFARHLDQPDTPSTSVRH
ncbi:MAG TPA: hypothetical protein VIE36_02650 [Methylomirabilota bacterium]|jgi:hypothetical protein